MEWVSFEVVSLTTYSADVISSGLSFLLVAAGQDHPGSSPCQIQSRGLANASVASFTGKRFTYIKSNKSLTTKGCDDLNDT